MAKIGSDLCNFYSKLDFLDFFFIKKYLLLFFTDFKLLMFHNNTWKISEIFKEWYLLKTCVQTTNIGSFAYFAAILLWEKMKIFKFFKTND